MARARIEKTVTSKFVTSRNLPLKDYYDRRNKILIIRETGGLGDILMMRMIFEDFKKKLPDAYLVVATPIQYHGALQDHPYIDEILDSRDVDLAEYVISYNISAACGKHEKRVAPFADKNRADIWANHCGVELEHHNMHLKVSQEVTKKCRGVLDSYGPGPHFLFSPVSAIYSKDLGPCQSNDIIAGIRKLGCNILCLHKEELRKLDCPTISAESIIDLLGFINASDYIVTVDTATFHAAGGLGKPQVAIFSWADGKVYGRWYDKYILVQRHRDNGDWDCGPCYMWHACPKLVQQSRKPCITSITSDEVISSVIEMMNRWPIESKQDGLYA